MTVAGLVLAAGEGRRFGGPKAIHVLDGERLVDRAVRLCRGAGCDPIIVVLGAWVGEVPGAQVVVNEAWAEGMGSSLRAGLQVVAERADVDRVLITLVDLPGLTVEALARVLRMGESTGLTHSIAQATFAGVPGHPVVMGREHWAGAATMAHGDRGARDYLRAHEDRVAFVEVGDRATGEDLDEPV